MPTGCGGTISLGTNRKNQENLRQPTNLFNQPYGSAHHIGARHQPREARYIAPQEQDECVTQSHVRIRKSEQLGAGSSASSSKTPIHLHHQHTITE